MSILDGVAGVSIIRFTGADVVRHALVQRIVEAYERFEAVVPGPDGLKPDGGR